MEHHWFTLQFIYSVNQLRIFQVYPSVMRIVNACALNTCIKEDEETGDETEDETDDEDDARKTLISLKEMLENDETKKEMIKERIKTWLYSNTQLFLLQLTLT